MKMRRGDDPGEEHRAARDAGSSGTPGASRLETLPVLDDVFREWACAMFDQALLEARWFSGDRSVALRLGPDRVIVNVEGGCEIRHLNARENTELSNGRA